MAVDVTLYAKTITWNGNTWNSGSGGPIALRYVHDGRSEEQRTGADQYPRGIFVVDKNLRAFVSLREVKHTFALASASSNLVATLNDGSGDTTLTLATLRLVGASGNQPRAVQGDGELAFQHESADGTTVPVS